MSNDNTGERAAGTSTGATVQVTEYDVGGDRRARHRVESYDEVVARPEQEVAVFEDGAATAVHANAEITGVSAGEDALAAAGLDGGRCPRCDNELALREPYIAPDEGLTVRANLECDACFFVADAVLGVVDVEERGDE